MAPLFKMPFQLHWFEWNYLMCSYYNLYVCSKDPTVNTSLLSTIRSWNNVMHCLYCYCSYAIPWWRHQMEISSALLAICVGNSPVTVVFPTQRPVTQTVEVFIDLSLKKHSSKQWLCCLRRHRAHYGVTIIVLIKIKVVPQQHAMVAHLILKMLFQHNVWSHRILDLICNLWAKNQLWICQKSTAHRAEHRYCQELIGYYLVKLPKI